MAVTPIINSQLTDIEQAIKDQTTAIENLVAVPVEEAVDEWLTAHPEATTTVQDGSITNAKVAPVGTGIDFQASREDASQSANADYSFIAGGANNAINDWKERDTLAYYSHAEGLNNKAFEWQNHVEGSHCIVDGKISHAEGNTVICTGNDSHAEGNRTVAGRKYYENVTTGAEDAGDSLGVLNYVLIPDSEGDVTSYFPNALIDNVTTRYGAGAQKDAVGNIYASGFNPAVWDGDEVVTVRSLRWAMHRICILRGSAEIDIAFVTIAKCTYTSGVGTKVYYFGENPTTNTIGIYSSYSPVVVVDGKQLGNGQHAEGVLSSATGYASHAEGGHTRAWTFADHAEGFYTEASGSKSHAEGDHTIARGECSSVRGKNNIVTGDVSTADGESNAVGGKYSYAFGKEAIVTENNRKAWAIGKRVNNGDNQYCETITTKTLDGVGWHVIHLIEQVENGKAYNLEVDFLARQIDGTAGAIGDSIAYKFNALISIASDGTFNNCGASRVLIGRTSGMTGDGQSSGVRANFYAGVYPGGFNSIALRWDGLADTTFYVLCHVKWIEMTA